MVDEGEVVSEALRVEGADVGDFGDEEMGGEVG